MTWQSMCIQKAKIKLIPQQPSSNIHSQSKRGEAFNVINNLINIMSRNHQFPWINMMIKILLDLGLERNFHRKKYQLIRNICLGLEVIMLKVILIKLQIFKTHPLGNVQVTVFVLGIMHTIKFLALTRFNHLVLIAFITLNLSWILTLKTIVHLHFVKRMNTIINWENL